MPIPKKNKYNIVFTRFESTFFEFQQLPAKLYNIFFGYWIVNTCNLHKFQPNLYPIPVCSPVARNKHKFALRKMAATRS